VADPQGTGSAGRAEDKSVADHAQELWKLIKTYAQQETIDPLKHLGRFVGFGLGAALLGGVGVTLLLVGLLRVLQEETYPHLTGSLTWIPYVVVLVVCGVLLLLAKRAISSKPKPKKGAR